MGRPQIAPENRKTFVGACVSKQIYNKIEKARGTIPRSIFVSELLEKHFTSEGQ